MPSVADLTDAAKRLLVGRPFRSEKLSERLLPKRIALPVFASDALSSVAYAPDEIFLTLSIAGIAAYTVSPWVTLAVLLVMLVVVTSYRQNVHAYPSGGGDYEVATVNLGPTAGLGVASALLVDYVLTVAVSIAAAAQYAATALEFVRGHETLVAVGLVLVLMSANLRGMKESGAAFAIPTYFFMVAVLGMSAWGFLRYLFGDLPQVASAELELRAEDHFTAGLTSLAGGFLILRAFSSGCAALTGVQSISNGVPAFRKPKSRNAATTLLLLGLISTTMLMSIVALANLTGLRYAEVPAEQLLRDGVPVGEDYVQTPVIGQLADAIFDHFSPAFYLVAAATGIILVLAANTAFNGFPVLASVLAKDGFLPRQLHTRGDRLAFSNGIIALAGAAIVLIVVFDARVTELIQLYIVGVFVSFTISQLGMVRHWTRLLRTETDRVKRRRMRRSRAINTVGVSLTGLVLVVVLTTKFMQGAWLALVAMAFLFVNMRLIRRHYAAVARELEPQHSPQARALPSGVRGVVLVSKLHKPTLRALAYARAARLTALEAVTVAVDPKEAAALQRQWEEAGIPVPLTVLDSPYRDIIRPVVQHVKDIRARYPRDLVTVYIPEYVLGHWWEALLHNQSALRLRTWLRYTPGVMVASVPWQLSSSAGAEERIERSAPGAVRRGTFGPTPDERPRRGGR
ncbi:amino acid transporter [Kineococcus xinjiangensis]|uniref:Amino acid transporter n=1 Tax=Kineococcus xinjiangensis TaxID=512762 RepID=A0A2S6IVV8_9ACTN|nr:APC family permease [Kineococcus xinjiangensis]PPK98370.1 amino acid transporter [Kineococcus xinjiangensis]